MSALEQALRQIDDQRQNAHPAQGAPTMMALPTEPLLIHALLRWVPALALVLLIAAAAGAGYWLYRTDGVRSLLSQRTETLTAAAPLAPATPSVGLKPPVPSEADATDPETNSARTDLSTFERPESFEQALLAWTSGQHAQAAQRWLQALRSLPPSTMALLLAETTTAEQVNNAVLARATALPWLVIPGGYAGGGPRWTVLVLTPTGELERTHAWLSRAGGSPLQWGTVAHWVARSEAADTLSPQPAAGPANLEPAGVVKPVPKDPVAADTLTRPPTAAAAVKPVAPAPIKPMATAPAASTVTAASSAALARAPTDAETPQLSRSAASETAALREHATPSAARSIESEFAAVEQDLAAARYDAALTRVDQLEISIGGNWRTRYLTGVALSGLLRWREAVPKLTQAREGNPSHARLALYLSVAQQELGQHQAAIETLSQALGAHAGMPELWLNKAHSLQALGRGEEAAFHYRRFMELSTNRQDLSQQRSWVQRQLDQKGSAW